MATLNFPVVNLNDPATLTYTQAGITWTWNETLGVWSSDLEGGSGGGGVPGDGVSVEVGESAPGSPSAGDLWFCTAEAADGGGRLYVYYQDLTSNQWVDVSQPGTGIEYLSKTEDDTAAGKITFQGGTIHQASVSVTGGRLVLNSVQSGKSVFVNLPSDTSLDTSSGIIHASPNSAILSDNIDAAAFLGTSSVALTVPDTSSYAIFRGTAATHSSGNVYNFYAEGSAPNHFASSLTVKANGPSDTTRGVRIGSGGEIVVYRGGSGTDNPVKIVRTNVSSAGNWRGIRLENHDASAASIIRIDGSVARSVDARLGATGVAMANGAADIVKNLQPKVITQGDETFNGFLPADLAGTYAEAMEGEAGATVAVGTYTDPEGVVETEVEEPEAIPFGATWVQTGTQDVMQSVCRENLIPLLTKALQEVIAENEDIKARLAALEGA